MEREVHEWWEKRRRGGNASNRGGAEVVVRPLIAAVGEEKRGKAEWLEMEEILILFKARGCG